MAINGQTPAKNASLPSPSQPEKSESEFRRLLEQLPAGAYTCDAAGLITYFNQQAAEAWGRAPKLNDPEDRFCGSFKLFSAQGNPLKHDECWMALALRENKGFHRQEVIVERPDGSRLTVLVHINPLHDESGKLLGAVNVMVDISDRKRAEEDLATLTSGYAAQIADLDRLHQLSMRLSNSLRLRPILDETLKMAVAVENADFGLLSLCDAEGQNLELGASIGFEEEFLKKVERIPAGSGSCGTCFAERRRVIVEDVETDPLLEPYRDEARQAGFRSVHSTPLITRTGKILGVLSTFCRQPRRPTEREMHLIDLGARQAVDFIENASLYAKLEESDRRKDEFLATLAHELRNPLAPIRNSLHIMRLTGDSSHSDGVQEMMERQVEHLVRLVDDLMEISRITRGKIELRRESVELSSVVRAALESSMTHIDAAGHQLSVSLPAERLMLNGDAVRLAQVFSNLLNNAAKYTDHGGQIWLTARRDREEVIITVKDTGVGIPAEKLPRVFDLFAQVERNRPQGGLGIGLSLVKRLVTMHGGQVEARSGGRGFGSEFTVRLPLLPVEPASVVHSKGTPYASAPAIPPRRILIVDDNKDAADTLGMLLRALGMKIQVVYSADAALLALEAFRPAVILTDLGMPGMDGYQLARRIRQDAGFHDVKLIALTGWGQPEDRHRSMAAGFDHHLVKPVQFDALQSLLLASPPTPA
ncbi:MAG: response regulator [Pirellulaceae bacterium]|nr:response regulator [Pirellulaceae bacterium]